ncbi:MAG: hypothetical protein EOO16_15035 [Chitinophagaceae bacterium]|nr:MAG: hypothetical protein EOO16_15035 [Chitinophagaceae bacterium]
MRNRKKIIQTLVVCAGALLAFTTARDVLTDVGTTVAEVKKLTVEQVYQGTYSMPWVNPKVRTACKSLPVGVREATMISLGKVVHDYVQSPEFEKDYFAYIDKNIRYKGPAADDEKTAAERKRREEYEMSHLKDQMSMDGAAMYCSAVANSGKMMLDMIEQTPELGKGPMSKADYERIYKEGTRLRALFDKDKEAFKKQYVVFKVDEELRSQRASQQHDQQQEQKEVARMRDYKSSIRKQLQEFLDATESINFKAATRPQGSKIVFVDPVYEGKPNEWKFYFRCGPEAISGARAYAKQWLNELN